MNKRIFLITLISSVFSLTSFADQCPSIKDIKNHHLHDWKAYDSEDGTLLSPIRLAQFFREVEQFVLAEWTAGSVIHCFYRDKSGSNFEAYLGKKTFTPENSKNLWYEVSGSLHCAAGNELCQFNHPNLPATQLAKN